MNFRQLNTFLFCLCMISVVPVFSQENIFFTGSAEFMGLAAMNDWSSFSDPSIADIYEDSRFGSALSNRFRLELNPSPGISAVIVVSSSSIGGYANPIVRFETTGLPLDPAYSAALELPEVDFNSLFEIDYAWASWGFKSADIGLGIMPLGWGSAWLMNPSDRVNLRSLESLFSEEKTGIPALSVDLALGWNFGFSGYLILTDTLQDGRTFLEETRPENLPFGVKALAYLSGWEISAGLARETFAEGNENPDWQHEYWIISDVTGDIASVGVTAEAALRLSSSERIPIRDEWTLEEALELSVGISYLIGPIDIEVLTEYIHLGSGAGRQEDYDVLGFLEGTRLLFAEDYLFGRIAWMGITGLSLELAALSNLNDTSLLLIPVLEWEPATDILLSLGCYFSIGDSTSEFGGSRILGPGLYWSPWDDTTIVCGLKVYY